MSAAQGVTGRSELDELARSKLAKVLGPERGGRVLAAALAGLSLTSITTPDQLYAVSERLVAMGGMEAAVGALLGVAAVIRGAAGPRTPDRDGDGSAA